MIEPERAAKNTEFTNSISLLRKLSKNEIQKPNIYKKCILMCLKKLKLNKEIEIKQGERGMEGNGKKKDMTIKEKEKKR